jgi:hypothetical protein
MAILVDEAIWPWRGLRWAHLVSDSHLDELHQFAHQLGMPYVAFQGDHYDIHTRLRDAALDAGARPVPGRELVVALRDAGLRRRGGVEPWQWSWRGEASSLDASLPDDSEELVAEAVALLTDCAPLVEVSVAARRSEVLVVVSCEAALDIEAGLVRLDERTTLHRSSGERGTFLEWVRLAQA